WPEIAAQKLDVVTSEVLLAKHRQKLTLNWMVDNPFQVLELMRLHVSQELKPGRDLYSRWLLPAAAVSALILRTFPGVWVLVLIVLGNILSVAMTYSAGGRFMVPTQPLLAALVAAAVVYVLRQASTLLRGTSAASPRASA
ncbi:MAG: hypothetical protein ABIS29_08805, partial [Vicinamibacterales bacterium]